MSDEADNVLRFPLERARVPAPARGYCFSCRVEMDWPTQGAWPEACPNGCTPLMLQSYLPEPGVFTWNVGQGPPLDDLGA